ncbi:MAG: shikimate dehydrogenase [Deltaproteobacteria bacterium]|nr:shikimate dehydrogenase [Deltaproteobacteria bacterium]MBW2141891.1 shikimate dehydrogenase [Deltaproteobacteria bacterium]MBW2323894.1 shikimate dehydrogenase [Deltaproteobacteria bacterium]
MKICASITESSAEKAIAAMNRAAWWADLLEIRLDYIEQPDLEALLANPPRPCLVTNRLKPEGGLFEGSEDERLALLAQAMTYNPAMIDLELATGEEVLKAFARRKGETALVISHHDFNRTPDFSTLTEIIQRMKHHKADVGKVVTRVQTPEEMLRLKDLLIKAREIGQPLAAFGLGPLSRLSRVLAPLWGSALSYCSIGQGKEAAPGQMTGPEMRRVFPGSSELDRVTPATELYGVLGSPVGHSLSPVIHNAAFKRLGLNCFYVPMDVEDAELAFQSIQRLGFRGVSVTRPHKIAVMSLLDQIEKPARVLGAVNTIVTRDGKYEGANTDWRGLVRSLEEHTTLSGRTALVAGAGGAARGAVYGLTKAKASVVVTNRSEERGRKLADEFGARFCPASQIKSVSPDMLINATPLGMDPWRIETPFSSDIFKPEMVVMDMVYFPLETRLLKEARQKGCGVVDGLSMLLHQAALQFEAWTGLSAPLEIMRSAAENILEKEEDERH